MLKLRLRGDKGEKGERGEKGEKGEKGDASEGHHQITLEVAVIIMGIIIIFVLAVMLFLFAKVAWTR